MASRKIIDSKLDSYRYLQNMDETLSKVTRHHINIIMQGIGWRDRALHASSKIAGSTTEGGLTARIFYPNESHGGNINKEIEVDIELVYCEFPIQCKNKIEDIEGKPGFVKMKFDEEVLSVIEIQEHRKKAEHAMTKEGYISSSKLKKIFCDNSEYDGTILQLIMSAALDLNPDEVEFKKSSNIQTKASVESSVSMYVRREYKASVKWDVVIAVKIPWWPSVAEEWIVRARKWPSKELIKEITKHSYMITKSSDEEKENEQAVENRYSFSHVERKLIERYSQQQKLVYLIFKSMIYHWLKPIDPENVTSFLGKTVMFWQMEESLPDDRYWDKDNATILFTVRTLFTKLKYALLNNDLRYYFIPSINIIKNMSHDLKMKLIDKISEIVEKTEEFLPDNIEDVIEYAEFIFESAKKCQSFAETYFEKGPAAFINKPALYPLVVEIAAKKIHNSLQYAGNQFQEVGRGPDNWLRETAEVEVNIGNVNLKFDVPQVFTNLTNAIYRGLQRVDEQD